MSGCRRMGTYYARFSFQNVALDDHSARLLITRRNWVTISPFSAGGSGRFRC
jgi:hypothetical protein